MTNYNFDIFQEEVSPEILRLAKISEEHSIIDNELFTKYDNM